MKPEKTTLTDQEILFCELYATGEAPFAGNAPRCYEEVFHDSSRNCRIKALKLLSQEDVQHYLEELESIKYEETKYMKVFLKENLKNIIQECSTAQFYDRKGTAISPAAMRSVAVNATKTLMDLYPLKESQVSKVSIEAPTEGGITFNVIIPGSENNNNNDAKEG